MGENFHKEIPFYLANAKPGTLILINFPIEKDIFSDTKKTFNDYNADGLIRLI